MSDYDFDQEADTSEEDHGDADAMNDWVRIHQDPEPQRNRPKRHSRKEADQLRGQQLTQLGVVDEEYYS